MHRAPMTAWLLGVLAFVLAMGLAFYLSGLALRGQSSAVDIRHEDPELEVAIETSRRTLPAFLVKLQKPPADAVSFAIKARLVQGDQAEALWVDHLTYADGVFAGNLADAPILMRGLKKGGRIEVPESQVVDWLIIHRTPDGDLREGGETDRVLRREAGHALRYPQPMAWQA